MPGMDSFASLIQKTAQALQHAGIEDPRREARLLVALAAEIETAALIAREHDPVRNAGMLVRLEQFTARRATHEPFAHIAGRRSFYGLDFISDARALVPRPDSEIVVETALGLMPRGRGVSVADLGTGSACLLCAILHERGGVRGTGVERDAAAAGLARENIKALGLISRAEIIVADWKLWTGWGDVDLIISNPPYIASAEIEALDDTVKQFDPRQALDGGADGLEAYRELARLGEARMKAGAWLVLEIGHQQRIAVHALLEACGFVDIQSAKDLGSRDRVVFGQRPTHKTLGAAQFPR